MQMTFLDLVQRTYREVGLTGTQPPSTQNQTGRAQDIVSYVLSAHEDIQQARPDWNFDWAQDTFDLEPGKDTYSPTDDFQIVGGVREMVRTGAYAYPALQGPNGRLWLEYLPWARFRQLTIPVVPGVPVVFCTRPDGNIQYYPRPNVATKVVHEYWRNQQVLSADTDVPRMPDWSHMAIVWRAVMFYTSKLKDWNRHDSAEEQYEAIYQRMVMKLGPQMMTGGALA